jgi:hypothetical protein
MLKRELQYRILTMVISAVWLGNGLFCKVLNGVPRHEAIVARILGETYARPITIAIGLSEVAVALLVFWGKWPRLMALAQIAVVIMMNIIEFFLARDLLLWGSWNAPFALGFVAIVFYHEFSLRRTITSTQPT